MLATLQCRALEGIQHLEKGQNKTTSASEPKNSELFATYQDKRTKAVFWCVAFQRIAWGRWESYCYLKDGTVVCKLHPSMQAPQHSSSKLQTKLRPQWTGCRFGNELLIPAVIRILTSFTLASRKILFIFRYYGNWDKQCLKKYTIAWHVLPVNHSFCIFQNCNMPCSSCREIWESLLAEHWNEPKIKMAWCANPWTQSRTAAGGKTASPSLGWVPQQLQGGSPLFGENAN